MSKNIEKPKAGKPEAKNEKPALKAVPGPRPASANRTNFKDVKPKLREVFPPDQPVNTEAYFEWLARRQNHIPGRGMAESRPVGPRAGSIANGNGDRWRLSDPNFRPRAPRIPQASQGSAGSHVKAYSGPMPEKSGPALQLTPFEKVKNGFRMAAREAEVRGKAAALSFVYPTMMPKTITPSVSLPANAPVAGIDTIIRTSLVNMASLVDGTHLGAVYVIPGWKNKVVVCTTLTLSGGADSFTFASSPQLIDDPALAQIGSFVEYAVQGGMALRIMNSTNMMTAGGTMICGQVPVSVLAAGPTFNALMTYPGVTQCDWPKACDMMHTWVPMSSGDTGNFAPSSTPGGAIHALFIAFRSVAIQNVDIEIKSNSTLVVLPSAQDFFSTQNYAIDRAAYEEALTAVELTRGVMPTDDVEVSFWEAAKVLGRDVLQYLKRTGLKSAIEAGVSVASSFLIGDPMLERFVRVLDSTDSDKLLAALENKEQVALIPDEVQAAMRQLFAWKVRLRDGGIHWKSPVGTITSHVPVSVVEDPFTGSTARSIKSTITSAEGTDVMSESDGIRVYAGDGTRVTSGPPEYVGHPTTHRGFLKGGCFSPTSTARCWYNPADAVVGVHCRAGKRNFLSFRDSKGFVKFYAVPICVREKYLALAPKERLVLKDEYTVFQDAMCMDEFLRSVEPEKINKNRAFFCECDGCYLTTTTDIHSDGSVCVQTEFTTPNNVCGCVTSGSCDCPTPPGGL